MKLFTRILLVLLCAAMVLAAPFTLSSPTMLGDARWLLTEEDGSDWDAGARLLDFLMPAARAEEAAHELPYDFSAAPKPAASGYTDTGYQDETIQVEMETREENGVIWRIAYVTIASPSQLRITLAGDFNKNGVYTSTKTAKVQAMAEKSNAVVAINGDYFSDDQDKRCFEFRMGKTVNKKTPKPNRLKDILVIDTEGDFHTYVQSNGVKTDKKGNATIEGFDGEILHAFTFGPALVQQGNQLLMNSKYGYNPNGREPRAAIGQLGKLQYVLVVAEGRGESRGVTHQEIADFMYLLGCQEAYNLDGGGSAALYFNGDYYNDLAGSERAVSDIIYFATALPEA